MTVTKTSTDVYFASGEIKFSALRDTFTDKTSTIKASDIFRDTDTNQPNPVVPDATENVNIAANDYSTDFDGTNLSLLTFRNSIKQYDFTQTGTDVKLDIDAQAWNNNLPKNINKKFIVNGTIGSDDTNVAAASVDAEIRNLTIDIGSDGKIRGAGGAGGVYGTNSGKGGDGGTALYAKSTATDSATKDIKINLTSSSELFAGGGGGGAGPTGGTGGTGASVHNLAGGAGGSGGNGGNGGAGQGYNNATATLGLAGAGGNGGSNGNSKEYQVTDYDINAETPLQTMSDLDYFSGAGGNGGNGGYGGNGGAFGSNGDAGTSNGQGVGRTKGGDTTSAKYYQFPTNEVFNTYGMLVGYSALNSFNFVNKHNGICTPFYSAANPVTDSNGTTIGYKTLVLYDSDIGDGTINCQIDIQTPDLVEGQTAASNPRFNINGYGLHADSYGRIKVNIAWNDLSGIDQKSLGVFELTGRGGKATWNYQSSGSQAQTFDYDPFIQSDWGSSPNIGVFGIYRDATHTGNYITFGGKYVSDNVNFTPPQIDSTGAMAVFATDTDSHNTGAHYIDILHINMPPRTFHAPIWARANLNGWHKGVEIKSNIPAFDGIVGVALNDSGDDNDFDDLVVFPTDQRTYEESTGRGLKLNDGSILASTVLPSLPTDVGTGGGAGRSVDGSNYDLVGNNSNNTKGES